jgi:hypothetical protein
MTSPADGNDLLSERRALRLAKLFDLRTFIGTLFLIFGVVVTIEGLTASQADIAKAAGVNLSLWTGPFMLAIGAIFIVWMLVKPPSMEVKHEDLSHAPERHHHE